MTNRAMLAPGTSIHLNDLIVHNNTVEWKDSENTQVLIVDELLSDKGRSCLVYKAHSASDNITYVLKELFPNENNFFRNNENDCIHWPSEEIRHDRFIAFYTNYKNHKALNNYGELDFLTEAGELYGSSDSDTLYQKMRWENADINDSFAKSTVGLAEENIEEISLQELHYRCELFLKYVKAVCSLHQHGFFCLDLKPENALYTKTNKVFKLFDTEFVKKKDLSQKCDFCYTEEYAPPEVINHQNDEFGTISEQSDYYELGVVLLTFLFNSDVNDNTAFKVTEEYIDFGDIDFSLSGFAPVFYENIKEQIKAIISNTIRVYSGDRYEKSTAFVSDVEKLVQLTNPDKKALQIKDVEAKKLQRDKRLSSIAFFVVAIALVAMIVAYCIGSKSKNNNNSHYIIKSDTVADDYEYCGTYQGTYVPSDSPLFKFESVSSEYVWDKTSNGFYWVYTYNKYRRINNINYADISGIWAYEDFYLYTGSYSYETRPVNDYETMYEATDHADLYRRYDRFSNISWFCVAFEENDTVPENTFFSKYKVYDTTVKNGTTIYSYSVYHAVYKNGEEMVDLYTTIMEAELIPTDGIWRMFSFYEYVDTLESKENIPKEDGIYFRKNGDNTYNVYRLNENVEWGEWTDNVEGTPEESLFCDVIEHNDGTYSVRHAIMKGHYAFDSLRITTGSVPKNTAEYKYEPLDYDMYGFTEGGIVNEQYRFYEKYVWKNEMDLFEENNK